MRLLDRLEQQRSGGRVVEPADEEQRKERYIGVDSEESGGSGQ